jgi:2-polyprenyl-3-methyl-5-hydroxy-6-metoxy-1,4-benzoquinol methylase
MATNIDAIVANLNSFYDMKGKSVLHVGAGGGQLIGYAHNARSILGVDSDPAAVSQLKTAIQQAGLEDRFSVIQAEFTSVSAKADVVFFELCLHEMDDPTAALLHARSLAPDILVLDHVPESRWAWYTCEEDKAARSWAAIRQLGVLREASFKATQHFETYSQLLSKVEVLGEQAIARSKDFSQQDDIVIGMDYAIALVQKDAA